jgi:hypothetical protein
MTSSCGLGSQGPLKQKNECGKVAKAKKSRATEFGQRFPHRGGYRGRFIRKNAR